MTINRINWANCSIKKINTKLIYSYIRNTNLKINLTNKFDIYPVGSNKLTKII